ncbi:hypothetical protein KNN17_21500, partial [Arthrobacter bambusae]|uniref:hypothetical protein n=1 Tax=Arthrobacter bambusae TaxID=1338426 RepID=UPI001F50F544
ARRRQKTPAIPPGTIRQTHHVSQRTPHTPASKTRSRKDKDMASEIICDWSLAEGMYVEIRLNRKIADQGRVEITTRDGQTLWLESSGALTRRLYMKAEYYEAWTAGFEDESCGIPKDKTAQGSVCQFQNDSQRE